MEARTEAVRTAAPTGATLPALFVQGALRGGELTILGEGGRSETRSHERLLEEGASGSATLRSKGVRPGDRVALVATSSFDFVIGCLATWNAGGVVVPLPYPVARRHSRQGWAPARRVLELVAPRAVLVSAEHQLPRPEGAQVITSSDLASGARAGLIEPAPEDAAVIQFTSGSTSSPRGVVLSHRAVTAFAAAKAAGIGYDPDDRLFTWLPLYHDLGFFIYLILPMACGWSGTLMPTRLFLTDPGCWLVELSRTGSTHCSAPNFAYGLVSRHIRQGLSGPVDLSRLKRLSTGGEFVNPVTVRSFLELAAPLGLDPLAFMPGYGLAEATCSVTDRRKPGLGFASDHVERNALAAGIAEPAPAGTEGTAEFASAGPPLPGDEVRICSPDGGELEERRVGEILVRGPTLMDGYLNDPAATAAAFIDEWLHTGDLGYLADGELYITGRAKDVIIVRGQNYFAEDIERIAELVPGVRKGRCAAVPIQTGDTEGIGLIAETKLESSEDHENCRKELVRLIWAETGVVPKRILLVPPGTVPKTTSGKLQRSLARRLLKET